MSKESKRDGSFCFLSKAKQKERFFLLPFEKEESKRDERREAKGTVRDC